MGKISTICSFNCCGVKGAHGMCCSLENRDFIMGPILDADEFIKNLSQKLDREINKNEIFIYYEEGRNLFPDKISWQDPVNYPALRINLHDLKKPCNFYNSKLKFCSVHDIRPDTCRKYECDYLKENRGE